MDVNPSHKLCMFSLACALLAALLFSCDFLSGNLPGEVRLEVVSESRLMDPQGYPVIVCTIRNTGTGTSYLEKAIYTAFKGDVAVDTLRALQVRRNDIPPGGEAVLEGRFYTIKSHSEYDRLERRIVWLDR